MEENNLMARLNELAKTIAKRKRNNNNQNSKKEPRLNTTLKRKASPDINQGPSKASRTVNPPPRRNTKALSKAEVARTYGPRAARLASTVLAGPVEIVRRENLRNRPNIAAHIRAWEIALKSDIATATQLAAHSGGVLEVDALASAAKERGWRVLDADRNMTKSVQWLISNTGTSTPILITKPKYTLGPMKKFAYGRYPPWGPPLPAPDNPKLKCIAPLNPFSNNTNWNKAKTGRGPATNSKHIKILKNIAQILGEGPTSKNSWIKKINKNNFNIKAAPKNNTGNGSSNEVSRGKGKDSAETDAIVKKEKEIEVMWMGRRVKADLDVALEKKITRGHLTPKAVPYEDIQLKKHSISVLLAWYTKNFREHGSDMRNWPPPPVIRLRFSSWFFGVPYLNGTNRYYGQEFTPASQELTDNLTNKLLPLFGLKDNPAYKDIFKVEKVTPLNFEQETGLSASAVTRILVENRQKGVENLSRASRKEARRGLAWKGINFGPGNSLPRNYLNQNEVRLRQVGDWGGWLSYILGPGWPVFKQRTDYHEFATEIVRVKIWPKIALLEQYWGLKPSNSFNAGLRSHKRTEPKRFTNTTATYQKFIESFSILKWLMTSPKLPANAAPLDPFTRAINSILKWAASQPQAQFNWAKVPAHAKIKLRNNASKNQNLYNLLVVLGFPSNSSTEYNRNINFKLIEAKRGSNILKGIADSYKKFLTEHTIDPSMKPAIKNAFKRRINALFSNENNNSRNSLKTIINRQ